MATVLKGTIKPIINLAFDAGASISDTRDTILDAANYASWTVANGTGADQADLVFRDQRTLAATTGEDLDLAGSLTDSFGTTITFARVKMLYVASAAANGDTIAVGGAAANQFINWVANATDIVNVSPGGAFMLFAPGATGYAVTAGTGDLLKIYNAHSAEGTYDIVIVGASA